MRSSRLLEVGRDHLFTARGLQVPIDGDPPDARPEPGGTASRATPCGDACGWRRWHGAWRAAPRSGCWCAGAAARPAFDRERCTLNVPRSSRGILDRDHGVAPAAQQREHEQQRGAPPPCRAAPSAAPARSAPRPRRRPRAADGVGDHAIHGALERLEGRAQPGQQGLGAPGPDPDVLAERAQRLRAVRFRRGRLGRREQPAPAPPRRRSLLLGRLRASGIDAPAARRSRPARPASSSRAAPGGPRPRATPRRAPRAGIFRVVRRAWVRRLHRPCTEMG